jgi:hypothetical protein
MTTREEPTPKVTLIVDVAQYVAAIASAAEGSHG